MILLPPSTDPSAGARRPSGPARLVVVEGGGHHDPCDDADGPGLPGQLPLGRPFTRADLDALPDDGLRHELIDGVLVVSPSPVHTHQRAVVRPDDPAGSGVSRRPRGALRTAFDVALADDTVMVPDVIAARRSD